MRLNYLRWRIRRIILNEYIAVALIMLTLFSVVGFGAYRMYNLDQHSRELIKFAVLRSSNSEKLSVMYAPKLLEKIITSYEFQRKEIAPQLYCFSYINTEIGYVITDWHLRHLYASYECSKNYGGRIILSHKEIYNSEWILSDNDRIIINIYFFPEEQRTRISGWKH